MENQTETKVKLSDIELKPLTVIIGKNLVEKSLLLRHLWTVVANDDAVYLPVGRTCIDFNRLKLTRNAELLLRDVGIELDIAWGQPIVYVTSSGKRLELTYAPPIIKEVVAAVLALSSNVRFIFIEEPEAHLHPGSQRLMARSIAEVVNLGKFVTITTNSDYLISEFNNLIALSKVPSLRKRLGYRDVEVLKPEMVAAYLVDGGVVKRLEVGDAGIPEDEFARVAEEVLRIRNELF
jgi:predicted ATPase